MAQIHQETMQGDNMKDGIIELDTDRAKELGFTSDKYFGYLWKKGNYVIISTIGCNRQNSGYLRELFALIQKKGYGIKVPNPFPKMEEICKHYGFKKTSEYFKVAKTNIPVYIKTVGGKER